ncbi:unnamed protein product [Rhizoctonia solani]|uniref:RRM domain-containing protein n=1 Tax=Rhizoctonia solani TaxID=456999 RepID=A0A8H2WHC0_9AGAM|nr:unnamed protein product [Rhizoctonia solani]CAE6466357.1 unnamed protein product [Rhizoctonia solani]
MAPKKGQKQKMSLGDFLGDEKFGSWADEMENLPAGPAARAEDASSDRYGRGDRDFSSRLDRPPGVIREDLPLPTVPPYIAYVGNLSFDLIEDDLGQFFAPEPLKSIKVIRDRDDKPKGFGYVEFETLDGLKSGLNKSGTQLNSRTVRVSVAEPPKERERGSGFGSFGGDSGDWRRDGPPATSDSRGPRGSRFDDRPPREGAEPSEANVTSDWRSNQLVRSALPAEPARRAGSGFREAPSRSGTELNWERKAQPVADTAASDRPGNFRRGSGFSTPAGDRESAPLGAAETDDVWRRGPPRTSIQTEEQPPRRGFGGRGSEGPASGGPPDAGDWRTQMRGSTARQASTDEKSPTTSQPQTPQGGRKQLNLLPRSAGGSNVVSPLSSPRMANSTGPKANPFGAARPVDISNRDREISDKLEKERESRGKDKVSFGRPGTGSRQDSTSGGPPTRTGSTPRDHSPAEEEKKDRSANKFDAKAAQVRSQTSFAAAAAAKKEEAAVKEAADKLAGATV